MSASLFQFLRRHLRPGSYVPMWVVVAAVYAYLAWMWLT